MQAAATTTEFVGSSDMEFDLNDSITSFKVWVEGVSVHGSRLFATSILLTRYYLVCRVRVRLHLTHTLVCSVNAFYVEYKLPIEVTSGDEVSIPFTVINTTANDLKVSLSKKSTGTRSARPSTASTVQAHAGVIVPQGP
jgi:hypothetical protein